MLCCPPPPDPQARIEDLVAANLQAKLDILHPDEMAAALHQFVEKDEKTALSECVTTVLQETQVEAVSVWRGAVCRLAWPVSAMLSHATLAAAAAAAVAAACSCPARAAMPAWRPPTRQQQPQRVAVALLLVTPHGTFTPHLQQHR
jgi:hypothetical protein